MLATPSMSRLFKIRSLSGWSSCSAASTAQRLDIEHVLLHPTCQQAFSVKGLGGISDFKHHKVSVKTNPLKGSSKQYANE